MNYKTIQTDGVIEDTIKKSRFICQVKRIQTEEEGRLFLAQIKKEHYKANHSCSAMIIGENSAIKRSSDDGEPSGTAGIPMLSVLEKQGLTNVLAVVTRYFGGIKLGTGGLIRAYSTSVAHAIREVGIVEVKKQEGVQITLTYSQYQTLEQFLQQEKVQLFETEFSEKVKATLYLDKEQLSDFLEHLTEFYNGKITSQKMGYKVVEAPVI